MRKLKKLFGDLEAGVKRLLELQRFKYTRPPPSRLNSILPRFEAKVIPEAKGNTGGKPLAEHWDAMWAEIAFQLWNGDLKPKRQADVTKAMTDWLALKKIYASETAITDRARGLWRRIEAGYNPHSFRDMLVRHAMQQNLPPRAPA